jgi:hypothetical protein
MASIRLSSRPPSLIRRTIIIPRSCNRQFTVCHPLRYSVMAPNNLLEIPFNKQPSPWQPLPRSLHKISRSLSIRCREDTPTNSGCYRPCLSQPDIHSPRAHQTLISTHNPLRIPNPHSYLFGTIPVLTSPLAPEAGLAASCRNLRGRCRASRHGEYAA